MDLLRSPEKKKKKTENQSLKTNLFLLINQSINQAVKQAIILPTNQLINQSIK
jgi:hypothetical protein